MSKPQAPKPPKCGTFMGVKGVQLSEVQFTFTQEVDTNQSSDDVCQVLTASTEDGGGGAYLILKTERWAIDSDDIDKFAAAMKRIVNLPEEYFL